MFHQRIINGLSTRPSTRPASPARGAAAAGTAAGRAAGAACAALVACAPLAAVADARADTVVASWVGPSEGSWSTRSFWSPVGSPSNGGSTAYSAVVAPRSQASLVWVDNWPTVSWLTIGNDDEAAIPNGLGLIIVDTPVQNAGTLSMHSAGNGTDLRIGAPVVELQGSGQLALSDNPWNLVRNNFGEVNRLVNGASHLIRGAGQLGYNSLWLTNHGTIRADLSTPLRIDASESQGQVNDGVMEAVDGATLQLMFSGFVDNTAGVIRAKAGSTVAVEGTHVYGGTLATEGDGVVGTGGGSTPLLENLTNTGTFLVRNGESAALSGVITNHGSIASGSTGNATDLRIHSAQVTLAGSGSVDLSNNPWNIVRNNFAEVTRLVNTATHTIRGGGQLGYNSICLTNYGTVQADQSTPLRLDCSDSQANVNQGVLQAVNGATLQIAYCNVLNNGIGVIRAKDGSAVGIEGTVVQGGMLVTEGSGIVMTNGGAPPYLDGVHNTGAFHTWNGLATGLQNTLTNDGTLFMDSTGNGTDLRISTSTVTLAGGGQLVMSNNPWNIVRNDFGEVTRLVQQPSHTIRGGGQLGYNSIGLANHGLIQADQPTVLRVDLADSQANVNDGTMQAADGGTLHIAYCAEFNNTGGTLLAKDASVVGIEGTHVIGGTLASEGSGYLSTISGALPYLDALHLAGQLHLWNGQALALMNTIVNDGTLFMDSTGNGTDLRIATPTVTLSGTGELRLSNNPWNIVRNDFAEYTTLVNDAAHTIRGAGHLGYNSLGIVNRGAIHVEHSSGMNIDPSDSAGFDNQGMVKVHAGSGATFNWGPFSQTGTVEIEADAGLTRNGDYTQSSGTTRVDGVLTMNSGVVQLNGGTLQGTGAVYGNVVNTGGTVAPGNSTGTLTVNGTYQQGAGGTLAIELGGIAPEQSDVLMLSGSAQLGGRLAIKALPGFTPALGQEFVVLRTTGGTLSGQFADVTPCKFIVTYFADRVVATVGSTVPADLNCSGMVDGADLGILLGAWGPCSGCAADLNGDGIVDGADLGILLGSWS